MVSFGRLKCCLKMLCLNEGEMDIEVAGSGRRKGFVAEGQFGGRCMWTVICHIVDAGMI